MQEHAISSKSIHQRLKQIKAAANSERFWAAFLSGEQMGDPWRIASSQTKFEKLSHKPGV